MALFVKDGPVDAYESITIFISKVALIPADEADDPVVVFESEAGQEEEIDLLAFQNDPYLSMVDDSIPAGS